MNRNDKDTEFYNRLLKELPSWVSHGWISPENKTAILASLSPISQQGSDINSYAGHSTQKTSIKPSFYALSFLGISLFSVGIILFFASNWQVMPKIVKMAELMFGLWLSYILAGFLLIRNPSPTPLHWFGQLLLFLGTIIFGTNIFLIAQIYHIDAHFPNGILIWSLAAWLVAWLLREESCLILSLILALIWTITESNVFARSIHWMFIPIFILNILPLLKEKWSFSWHVALMTLILWMTNNIVWLAELSPEMSYALYFGLCSIASITIWILCLRILEVRRNSPNSTAFTTADFSLNTHHFLDSSFPFRTLDHYALFFFLLNLGYLTFPDLFKIEKLTENSYLSFGLISIFILAHFVTYAWFYKIQKIFSRQLLAVGGLLFIALATWCILNLFYMNASWICVGYNVLFVAFLLWLITMAYELKDAIIINLSFLFFAVFVIVRYFDVFWNLLDRSFFFMGGGLLILLSSYLLERKRRTLTKGIKP